MGALRIDFYTGFPGFIASQLIEEAFAQQACAEVYVLVKASEHKLAEVRRATILARQPHAVITIIDGDITLPELGLSQADIVLLQSKITHAWHLAAVYDLAVPRAKAWKVNVHGTTMMNEFMRRLPHLQRYIYFSSAYVCGTRTGVIKESELMTPKCFHNAYEETKFEAELRVEDLKRDVPVTIVRPSIVCGHSQTGATTKFDGLYFSLNAIEYIKKMPVMPYVGTQKKILLNLVPVDFVAKAALYFAQLPEAEGQTYHIVDDAPHSAHEVYRAMAKAVTKRSPLGVVPVKLARKYFEIKSVRQKLGMELEWLDYNTANVKFEAQQTTGLLQQANISCPDFLTILPNLLAFYEKHKNDKAYHISIK